MNNIQLIKTKFFAIIIFLITGFALLYFGYQKKHQVSSYQLENKTITVIELPAKNRDFNLPLIFGIGLISMGVLLTLQTYLLNSPITPTPTPNRLDKITKQEKKVVSLIEQGKTNKEIATELSISTSTVKTHINNIFKKAGVSSRDELLQII